MSNSSETPVLRTKVHTVTSRHFAIVRPQPTEHAIFNNCEGLNTVVNYTDVTTSDFCELEYRSEVIMFISKNLTRVARNELINMPIIHMQCAVKHDHIT